MSATQNLESYYTLDSCKTKKRSTICFVSSVCVFSIWRARCQRQGCLKHLNYISHCLYIADYIFHSIWLCCFFSHSSFFCFCLFRGVCVMFCCLLLILLELHSLSHKHRTTRIPLTTHTHARARAQKRQNLHVSTTNIYDPHDVGSNFSAHLISLFSMTFVSRGVCVSFLPFFVPNANAIE